MMKKPEILAPAGDMEKLKTAVLFGADAVYLSGVMFGMRAFAGNFNNDEMVEAVEYCHDKNVNVYVTVNIIAKNSDFEELPNYLKSLEKANVDAVIVADLGVFTKVKEHTNLPIHISTQFGAMNYETCNLLEKMGAERVVLPRELTIYDIKEIRKKTNISLEVFVHGAMCMAISGRCMISKHLKNRDANQGECNQSCRFSYDLVSKANAPDGLYVEEDINGSYFFNSKDLCLIRHIPELFDAGVDSLKIEGRMKAQSYLSSVVKVYREAVNSYFDAPDEYEVKQEWIDELGKVSNRGYTIFNFYGEKDKSDTQEINSSRAISSHDIVGIVKDTVDDERMVVEAKNSFRPDEEIEVLIPGKRVVHTTFSEIFDVLGNKIEKTKPNQIVVIRRVKSACSGAILRKPKNG